MLFRVPNGRFPKEVLDSVGYAYRESDPADARFNGKGLLGGDQPRSEDGHVARRVAQSDQQRRGRVATRHRRAVGPFGL